MEEHGKGVGCLMDIPGGKASTPGCFCFLVRCSEMMGLLFFFVFGGLGPSARNHLVGAGEK